MDMDRVWGVTVGAGQGGCEERGKGENWNNCNRITIKKGIEFKPVLVHDGINALTRRREIRRYPASYPSPPSRVRAQPEGSLLQARKRVLIRTGLCGRPGLSLPSLQNVRNNGLCQSHLFCGLFVIAAEQTKRVISYSFLNMHLKCVWLNQTCLKQVHFPILLLLMKLANFLSFWPFSAPEAKARPSWPLSLKRVRPFSPALMPSVLH